MGTDQQGAAAEPSLSLGIDVGGTGIKGGLVDVRTGRVVGERIYLATPRPATPDAVAGTIADLVSRLGWEGPVGIALPSVIHDGTAQIAANIDQSWIGCELGPLFDRHLPGRTVSLLNDADAAGVTEVVFGAARGVGGLVVLLTFGTGIGSALLVDGRLVPNTEFGHMLVRDVDERTVDEAEHLASGAVRNSNDWGFEQWAPHVSRVLTAVEDLLWPSLIVVGGGVSEAGEEWFPLLDNRTPVVAASRLNDAGIIGAAAVAAGMDGVPGLGGVLPDAAGSTASDR